MFGACCAYGRGLAFAWPLLYTRKQRGPFHSQICEAMSRPFSARKSTMTAPVMSVRDALKCHVIWQVSMIEGNDSYVWTTLPDDVMTELENARNTNSWPSRYLMYTQYVLRLVPEPAMVNTLTGEVRRMQRAVVMGPRVHDV